MRCFCPPSPLNSLEDTGLEQSFIEDLVLKHLFFLGEFKLFDVAERVRLPLSLVEQLLEGLRSENLIEVKGAANYTKTSYVFRLTGSGRVKSQEILDLSRYTGPAPVSWQSYCEMVQKQTVKGAFYDEDSFRKALSHLVVNEGVLRRLGPAIIAGQSVFIYGPSGNGKTSIAEAIGKALPENIYLPYAIALNGQIITVYDPVCHVAVDPPGEVSDFDSRWVLVKRPVVSAGGELSLKMLDLSFDPFSKSYQASLQMKANNGLFILDDFGRQQEDPVSLLNRWLVPLERQIDHMTLQTGMTFVIPLDVLVIFSTDLDPKSLLHQAFLRRMHYKIRIDRPTEEEYLEIFKAACQFHGVAFSEEVYTYLNERWYGAHGVERSACHPKDLIGLIVADSCYCAKPPLLTLESVSAACEDYFI